MKIDPQEMIGLYLEETEEMMAGLEGFVDALRQNPEDGDAVFGLHRIAHTMKTSAGLMGFKAAKEYALAAEVMMSPYRRGEKVMSAKDLAFIAGVFAYIRTINGHIEDAGVEDGEAIPPNTNSVIEFNSAGS